MLFVALVTNLIFFALAWLWCICLKNFSPVDAFWAFGIGGTAFLFLLGSPSLDSKPIIASLLIGAWSLRLGIHLAKRIAHHHPSEDTRYIKLREDWKGRENSSFFWFFQAQAISVFLLALPFYFIGKDLNPAWNAPSFIGVGIMLIGLIGESIADSQMTKFKATNSNPKSVCRAGLWKYSRHPNYFFESIIWLGIFLFAAGSPYGWISLYAPIIITYLLLKVTGIPPTEAAALKRKGEAYRNYQRTTSAFIPLPPKPPTDLSSSL
jgi:steroid 5-alpha reductase family enzyme